MRRSFLFLVLATGLLLSAPTGDSSLVVAGVLPSIQESPSPDANVQESNDDPGMNWAAIDPLWMAVGAIAVVAILGLIIMAARSGHGANVVRWPDRHY